MVNYFMMSSPTPVFFLTVKRLLIAFPVYILQPYATGQQWDAPNGWAPLQWMTIKGLENYGFTQLSNDITNRWLRLNEKVFLTTHKMMEKYNVIDTTLKSGGGEYPAQDGFGWTNGVYRALSDESGKGQ